MRLRGGPPTRIALALLVLLLVACEADEPVSPAPTGSATAPASTPGDSAAPTAPPSTSRGGDPVTLASIPELVERVQPSVVSILRPGGGEGSGVIWSSDGIVVTNHHVVRDVAEVVVAFADGQRVPGEVLASDPRTDLAIVAAERDDLPPATFSEALPEVGELALAVGNPIGFENSVTQGIVSGLHRSIPGSAQQSAALVDLIQTDAAISPGNSGGALVNGRGEVMGVNVAYIPPQARAVALGFAIPAPTVTSIVEQLLEDGTAEHPYLGIRPVTLTEELRQRLNVEAASGVAVLAIEEGGPADTAGIEPGDVITALDGERLDTTEDLLGRLRRHLPGDEVTMTVARGGDESEVTVTLGELPPVG